MDYHGGMVTRLNQSDFVKTALRLPPDVHAKIHEAASATGRSYNAEIVARLQSTFASHGVMPPMGGGASPKTPVEGVDTPLSKERLAEILAMLESGGVSIVPAGTAKITRPKKD